jgi:hypothetical protein
VKGPTAPTIQKLSPTANTPSPFLEKFPVTDDPTDPMAGQDVIRVSEGLITSSERTMIKLQVMLAKLASC